MDWSERTGRRIQLRDFHVVLAIAEAGSMTRAAERLATSHPVVSKTIAKLEANLGVKLFDRSAKGVELTNYGRALIDCGVAVFDEVRQGLKRIEFLTHPDAGELRIGCPEIIIGGLLPAIAESFAQHYPRVCLNVIHADVALLQYKELRERDVELLIGRIPGEILDEDLAVETLFDEPFVLVAGVDSRWARLRRIDLGKLVHEPWVLPPYNSVPGRRIAEIFRANSAPLPRPSMVTLSGHLTATLIGSGRYLGLLPGSLVELTARRTGLKALRANYVTQRIGVGLITLKNRTLSPLAERFIDHARDFAKSLSTSRKITEPTTRRSFINV
jgi:DNA-binding transcriptional LysR family regulator